VQSRLTAATAALQDLTAQTDQRQADLTTSRAALSAAETRLSEASAAVAKEEASLGALRDQAAGLGRDVERAQSDLVRCRQESEALAARRSTLLADIASEQRAKDMLDGDMRVAREEAEALRLGTASLKDVHQTLSRHCDAAQRELSQGRKEGESERRRLTEVRLEVSAATAELSSIREEVDRLSAQGAALRSAVDASQRAQVQAHLEEAEAQRRLRDVQAESRLRVDDLRRQEEAAAASMTRARAELEGVSSSVANEQLRREGLSGECGDLSRAVEEARGARQRAEDELQLTLHALQEATAQVTQLEAQRVALRAEVARTATTLDHDQRRLLAVQLQVEDGTSALGRVGREVEAAQRALRDEGAQLAHQRLLLRCAAEELASTEGRLRVLRAEVSLQVAGTAAAVTTAAAAAVAARSSSEALSQALPLPMPLPQAQPMSPPSTLPLPLSLPLPASPSIEECDKENVHTLLQCPNPWSASCATSTVNKPSVLPPFPPPALPPQPRPTHSDRGADGSLREQVVLLRARSQQVLSSIRR
jgi:chromosome segregation ATPase